MFELDVNQIKIGNERMLFEIKKYSSFGEDLEIKIPSKYSEEFKLKIDFTSGKGSGIYWLSPNQTFGKTHPYFFTQCEVKSISSK